MAVVLLPKLDLPPMGYDTALYVALQAAQKIAMVGNDPELTEGPDGRQAISGQFGDGRARRGDQGGKGV
jgi:hypothetical protein